MPNRTSTKALREIHPNVSRKRARGLDQQGQKSAVWARTPIKPDTATNPACEVRPCNFLSYPFTTFSSADSRSVFCPGELDHPEQLEPIHSCPPEPFSTPAQIPPLEDTAQLADLWAEVMADKNNKKSAKSQGKLSSSNRASTFFNPRFMRLFTDTILSGSDQQPFPVVQRAALRKVMQRMLASCKEILKKNATNGPNVVGKDIWLQYELDGLDEEGIINAEINYLHNNEKSNEEEWVVRLWLEFFFRYTKSFSCEPPCLIRFLQCRMETVHVEKAHTNTIHPRYPPIIEPHQMRDMNSMGTSSERWDNYHPNRNGYVYFDVCNGVKVKNDWDPNKLRDLPLLRMFEDQKLILLSFIAELKPEAVGDESGDALRTKVEHYLLTNGATYLHEHLKLRALGSGNAFEVGDDFIIHLISGIGPWAYHYICRLRPPSTKDQLEEQLNTLRRDQEKRLWAPPSRAQLSQESLGKRIDRLAEGEENIRYEIVLMELYNLHQRRDRDNLRELLNDINQVAFTVQLQQMTEDIDAALRKTANKADSEMAFYWKRNVDDGSYRMCWDKAPFVDDTHNDIYENLRPVLRPASEGAAFDVQSVEDSAAAQGEDSTAEYGEDSTGTQGEDSAAAQGEVDIIEDFQNPNAGNGMERLLCPHDCDRSQRNGGYANQLRLAAHISKYHYGRWSD